MARGKETPGTPGEFSVKAEGADVIFNWLRIRHNIASKGITGNFETSLHLGGIETQDEVLDTIGAGVSYNPQDLDYEMSAIFVPHQDTPFSGPPISLGDSLAIPVAFPSERNRGRKLELGKIREELKKRLNITDFSVEFDKEAGLIRITKAIPSTDRGDSYVLHHFNRPLMTEAYCLHFHGSPESDVNVFSQRYSDFAQLLKLVADSIYKAGGCPSPSKTLSLAPPKSTEPQNKTLEKSLTQTLTAAGLLDDESLVADIRNRILLEKRPDISFDDIGGQQKAKDELKVIAYSLTNPDAFQEEGTRPPKGVLLYGPPGTGKTMLAKALAREAQANIYIVRLSDVIHHLYGKSERLIAEIFKQARQDAPVVILFDEIDALAAQRQYSSEATSRIVSVLLTELSGLEERNGDIVVVGATNRLDAIDPALLRPGRFDLLIEVTNPNDAERRVIFEIKMQQAREIAGRELFADDLDMQSLIAKTEGMSGADIEELIRRVLVKNVRAKMQGNASSLVTTDKFLSEITGYESIRKAKAKTMGLHGKR